MRKEDSIQSWHGSCNILLWISKRTVNIYRNLNDRLLGQQHNKEFLMGYDDPAQCFQAIAALQSIANSACCGCCQEAARVARKALRRCDGWYLKRDELFSASYQCALHAGHLGSCGSRDR